MNNINSEYNLMSRPITQHVGTRIKSMISLIEMSIRPISLIEMPCLKVGRPISLQE